MYYILQNPVGPNEILADLSIDRRFMSSWVLGKSFEDPPPDPLELTWVPENENGRRVAFYSSSPVLMLKELVAALRSAGVNNLEEYPVVIKSSTGKPECRDYVAVNIVGSIAAADMELSEILDDSDGPLMTVMFGSLVIDETKAKNMLLFRLAENISTVVIHDSVVDILKSKGGFGLTFLNPRDFVG
jgi:hypothetical protein